MKTSFMFKVILMFLILWTLWKIESTWNTNDMIEGFTSSVVTGADITGCESNCPNLLLKNQDKYYLLWTQNTLELGKNPQEFENHPAYLSYLNNQSKLLNNDNTPCPELEPQEAYPIPDTTKNPEVPLEIDSKQCQKSLAEKIVKTRHCSDNIHTIFKPEECKDVTLNTGEYVGSGCTGCYLYTKPSTNSNNNDIISILKYSFKN